ncbi:hypothetical protein AK812_SmicGene9252 [Symbiodinium microadriaticum]|uniref:Uncharacterized protein n=1 Tax=Symbiodinium microadriaticum TaxID=2951 RepID=A0A1Q9EIT8_SYMMI|nr:hypothetical protein AK812_SmicGene9252 [Symbiodinium microadriaticum]
MQRMITELDELYSSHLSDMDRLYDAFLKNDSELGRELRVPVKRRKAVEAPQVSNGPVRQGKKEPSISRPAPAGTSTLGTRRLAFRSGVTGKQLTLSESLNRTSSTPRSCVSIDADETADV